MRKTLTWRYVLVGALACATYLGCGDDDSVSDGGTSGDGGAANGGKGGSRAGSGGAGGRGGAGAGGRSAGSGGSGGTGGMMMTAMCSEPKPTQPVVCGGQTCNAPTNFMMNECIVPCCVQKDGAEVCGSKSTSPMFPSTQCELPVVEDPSCPDIESNGTTFQGCCNAAESKCGIISTVRPGCITMSQALMLPNPLQSCTPGGGDDAGTDDAGI